MRSMRRWLAVLLTLCVLLLAACSAAPAQDDPSADPGEFTTAPLPTGEDGNVTYRVTVQDESGKPIPGVFLQLKLEQGTPAVTNDQGVATWNLPQAAYTVSFVQLPAGYTYPSAAQEFFFKDDSGEMTITLMVAQ